MPITSDQINKHGQRFVVFDVYQCIKTVLDAMALLPQDVINHYYIVLETPHHPKGFIGLSFANFVSQINALPDDDALYLPLGEVQWDAPCDVQDKAHSPAPTRIDVWLKNNATLPLIVTENGIVTAVLVNSNMGGIGLLPPISRFLSWNKPMTPAGQTVLVGDMPIATCPTCDSAYSYGNGQMYCPQCNRIETSTASVSASAEPVEFTSVYPAQIQIQTDYALYLYVHLPDDQADLQQLIASRPSTLGNIPPRLNKFGSSARLAPGSPLQVTLQADANAVQFQTSEQNKVWQGNEALHFVFPFRLQEPTIAPTLTLTLTIRVLGFVIASQTCSLSVDDGRARLTAPELLSQTTPAYQTIFVSYSRRDKCIVENYRQAQQLLGNNVFMDVYSLRPGEAWRDGLARAILSADVFQLFWSSHAATSDNVRAEYRYALEHRCAENTCADFIRPIIWQEPKPPIPKELGHLNFFFSSLRWEC